jgi:hypothetical protein
MVGFPYAHKSRAFELKHGAASRNFLNIAKKVGVKHIVHLGACGDNDTRVAHYGWHQPAQSPPT